MRSILQSLGEQIKQLQVGSAMTLVISALALLRAYNFLVFPINNVLDLLWVGLWFLVFVLLTLLVANAIGAFLVSVSETIPAYVIVVPGSLDKDMQEVSQKKKVTVRYYAVLKVRNKESSELSNCYAVLRQARYSTLQADEGSPFRAVGRRLRWRENLGTDNSEISIGPHTGEATLRVYHLSINLSDNSIARSAFDICESNPGPVIEVFPVGTYAIEIDIYGKMKGKDVKITPFIGYVDVTVSQTDGETSFGIKLYEGKHTKRGGKVK